MGNNIMNLSVFVLLATLVVFAIIVIVWRIVRKEQVDHREVRRQQSGFLVMESPPEAIVNRIRALQPNKTGNVRVSRVSQKKIQAGELYLYDGTIPSIDSDTNLEDRLIAVSPLLHLPQFALYPLPQLGGKWGNMMSDMVGSATEVAGKYTGLKRVRLMAFPDFDKKYTLLAKNEEQVRAFFTAERVQSLVSLDSTVALYAVGDSLAITAVNAQGKNADDVMDLETSAAIALLQGLQS
jgi:hypothetical protein